MHKNISTKMLSKLQLVELDTCARCANCAEFCPTYTERREPDLIPGGRAKLLSEIVKQERNIWSRFLTPKPIDNEKIERITNTLYLCSLCGRCQVVCSFFIQTHELWETFRAISYDANLHPKPLQMVAKSIRENGNPYGADPEIRSLWIEYSGLEEAPIKKKARVVYFAGCTSSLKAQTQNIPYAVSSILNQAKESWTLLGDDEKCCGAPSIMAGDWEGAKELAKHNTELIESLGAERVVTSCPSCYRALKHKYSLLLGRKPKFEVTHAVELAHEYLWKSGRLLLTEKLNERIAYHDPCELARLCGIIGEPREILMTLADNIVEFPENRLDVRCCGGGGLLQAVDNDLRIKIAQKRMQQAEKLKVDILTSACPACKITLVDGARNINSDVEILDLMELLARKLGTNI